MVKSCPRGYWPIGSANDYAVLQELRAHADLLIHGKKTATWYKTVDIISKPKFVERRKALGKAAVLPYCIITDKPDDTLLDYVENTSGNIPYLVTTQKSTVSERLEKATQLQRCGEKNIDLQKMAEWLFAKGFRNVLIEGEPTLLGSFLGANLIDEIFLTIAPKLFGNRDDSTMTVVEGNLFAHTKIKRCQVLSVNQVENEIFLRYKIV